MELIKINYSDNFNVLTMALDVGGAFLVVSSKDGKVNPMTIGWASVGRLWSRPTLSVLVRKSRFTYCLIDKAQSFTVCAPATGTLKSELTICGTKSGRETDKVRPQLSEKIRSNFKKCLIFG